MQQYQSPEESSAAFLRAAYKYQHYMSILASGDRPDAIVNLVTLRADLVKPVRWMYIPHEGGRKRILVTVQGTDPFQFMRFPTLVEFLLLDHDAIRIAPRSTIAAGGSSPSATDNSHILLSELLDGGPPTLELLKAAACQPRNLNFVQKMLDAGINPWHTENKLWLWEGLYGRVNFRAWDKFEACAGFYNHIGVENPYYPLYTPLFVGILAGCPGIVALMINSGAKCLNSVMLSIALSLSIQHRDMQTMERLLNNGASVTPVAQNVIRPTNLLDLSCTHRMVNSYLEVRRLERLIKAGALPSSTAILPVLIGLARSSTIALGLLETCTAHFSQDLQEYSRAYNRQHYPELNCAQEVLSAAYAARMASRIVLGAHVFKSAVSLVKAWYIPNRNHVTVAIKDVTHVSVMVSTLQLYCPLAVVSIGYTSYTHGVIEGAIVATSLLFVTYITHYIKALVFFGLPSWSMFAFGSLALFFGSIIYVGSAVWDVWKMNNDMQECEFWKDSHEARADFCAHLYNVSGMKIFDTCHAYFSNIRDNFTCTSGNSTKTSTADEGEPLPESEPCNITTSGNIDNCDIPV